MLISSFLQTSAYLQFIDYIHSLYDAIKEMDMHNLCIVEYFQTPRDALECLAMLVLCLISIEGYLTVHISRDARIMMFPR